MVCTLAQHNGCRLASHLPMAVKKGVPFKCCAVADFDDNDDADDGDDDCDDEDDDDD